MTTGHPEPCCGASGRADETSSSGPIALCNSAAPLLRRVFRTTLSFVTRREFEGVLESVNGRGAGVALPFDSKAVFGRAPAPVRVTVADQEPFTTSVAVYGGAGWIGFRKTQLAGMGLTIGNSVTMSVELDDQPRTSSTTPPRSPSTTKSVDCEKSPCCARPYATACHRRSTTGKNTRSCHPPAQENTDALAIFCQDTLRSQTIDQPFFDPTRVRNLMQRVAAMQAADRAAIDSIILRIVSTCLL